MTTDQTRQSRKEAVRAAFAAFTDHATHERPMDEKLLGTLNDLTGFDEPAVARSAQKAAYKVFKASRRGARLAHLIEAAAQAPRASTPFTELLAYCLHLDAWSDAVRSAGLSSAGPAALAASDTLAGRGRERAAALRDALPHAAYHDLQAAKVTSLGNRSDAVRAMRRWQRTSAGQRLVFGTDEGVTTYFAEDEVSAGTPNDVTSELSGAIASRPDALPPAAFEVLLSCDARFLRTHGAVWAVFLPVIVQEGGGLTMLVTGDAEEGASAIAEFRKLIEANDRFRRAAGRYARAVATVPVPVPPGTGAERTFHACARYLYARQVLGVAGRPVLVADVDMTPSTSLAAFARSVRGPIACPAGSGAIALLPWRRYIANTVWLDGSPACIGFLRDVERYVLHGLPKRESWTLDQNALAFAAERHPTAVEGLPSAMRPLKADPVRNAFERLPL